MHNETPVIDQDPIEKSSKKERIKTAAVWTGIITISAGITVGSGVVQWKMVKMGLETAKLNHAAALLKQS